MLITRKQTKKKSKSERLIKRSYWSVVFYSSAQSTLYVIWVLISVWIGLWLMLTAWWQHEKKKTCSQLYRTCLHWDVGNVSHSRECETSVAEISFSTQLVKLLHVLSFKPGLIKCTTVLIHLFSSTKGRIVSIYEQSKCEQHGHEVKKSSFEGKASKGTKRP